ncbi:hypothetical protein QR680_015588 [Steinernema hermaphroditum]|uniref:Peptidase M13 N-terminal domain-containing protein n=1 Tax=Steinernema hermaphroditum TaxID=289476 RepID=A0AA39LL58_9BILA|nr:hypothetical protein QR680_015588 [Steinernema hermaphroditum]
MRLLVGLLLLIPLCAAFDPHQLAIFNHKLSSSVHPCDDFHEFVYNTKEYHGRSAVFNISLQPFNVGVEEAFLADNDPIVEFILPMVLEEKQKETLRKIGKKRALEALKKLRNDTVMHIYREPFNLIQANFIEYYETTTDYSSARPLIQGFVDGFFVNAAQSLKNYSDCPYYNPDEDGFLTIITPFDRSELEFIKLSVNLNRTVESYFNITSDLGIEEQREIGRQLGLKTPAFDFNQTVPLVYYEGKTLVVDLKKDYTRIVTTFENSHPLVQGAVDAFFEFRKDLNITKKDMVRFENVFDTKWAEKVENDVLMELKAKKPFKLSLLDTVASFDDVVHTALQPLTKYMQLLVAKYTVQNNMNPKAAKEKLVEVFAAIKGVIRSAVEKGDWVNEDNKKMILDRIGTMQLAPGIPEKFDLEFLTAVIEKIQNEFLKKKTETQLPQEGVCSNCDALCAINHYMELLQQSYDSNMDNLKDLLPVIDFNMNNFTTATAELLHDTLIIKPLSITDADLTEPFLYGNYGLPFAATIMSRLIPIIRGLNESKCFTSFDLGGWNVNTTLELVRSIKIALKAFLNQGRKTRGQREDAAKDIQAFFYGLHSEECFLEPVTRKEEIYAIIPEFTEAFNCKPGQKMFGKGPVKGLCPEF